ncbi:TetR/AcrR family transcriptional regulator [Nocardiopsis sp. NPDC050513]|uniref:TetR/AcrR family transcriptional regulator n=1 Tax=Nocardiopsis sp. NPDC050513 TaxID=3364338 RepID=UPI00379B0974
MDVPVHARRADARRNRDLILGAARRAIATEGTSVPLALIARAAGVGAGTVHRHFPTKEALVEAVLAAQIDEIVVRVEHRRGRADPGRALVALLTDVIESAGGRSSLCEFLRADAGWPRTTLHASALRLDEALREHLSAAQRGGRVRPDVTVEEVKALITGCVAMTVSGHGGERMARLVLEVLCGVPAHGVTEQTKSALNRDSPRAPHGTRDHERPPRWCRICGVALAARRSGRPARYCGPTCRKRAQRRRDRSASRTD